ncbi:MAG: DUF4230 domain-containing protein [Eubacterium sp.]|nr:DUF4230 domain-containing protein [Eubacterium sp.]
MKKAWDITQKITKRINKNRPGLLFAAVLFLSVSFPAAGCGIKNNAASKQQASEGLELGQMQSVCELATLECYYHNTAKSTSTKPFLFWNTSKKLWIEYSGIVKIGIDISKLDLKVNGNVVTIVLPDAKILSCKVDDASLSKDTFYSETKGLGAGKVTAEDQSRAFAEAQENMLEEAQKDDTLLLQAKERAKALLLNYVKNISDAVGIAYEVQWETAAP